MRVDLLSGCGPTATLIASTNTDSAGRYLFGNLCLGTYTVSFQTPAGYATTKYQQNSSVGGLPRTETDSDCNCTGGTGCGCA